MGALSTRLLLAEVGDWYPHPFLDPDQVGGYGGVAAYCVGVAVAVGLVVLLVARVGDWLGELARRQPVGG